MPLFRPGSSSGRPLARPSIGALVTGLALHASVAAQGIFLQATHPASGRSAVLEDDGHVAYLYLTAASSFVPEKQVVAYTRKPPVPKVDWWELKLTGESAPIWREVASASATVPTPKERELTFRWSADGQAVAVLRNGRPLAFAAATRPTGYSKALAKPSVIGSPWDQPLFDATFR